MIEDCDSAIMILANNSGVVAETLSYKRDWENPFICMNIRAKLAKRKQARLILNGLMTLICDMKEY